MNEQKPLGKTPLGGNPTPGMTYLPTSPMKIYTGMGMDSSKIKQGRD